MNLNGDLHCNHRLLFKRLQDLDISRAKLIEKCGDFTRLNRLGEKYDFLTREESGDVKGVDGKTIGKMIEDRGAVRLHAIVVVADVLELQDYDCLIMGTQIQELDDYETGYFNALTRMLHNFEFPRAFYSDEAPADRSKAHVHCLFDALNEIRKSPDVLEEYGFPEKILELPKLGSNSLKKILKAICCGGLLVFEKDQRGVGRFRSDRPSTRDMLQENVYRQKRLFEAIDHMYDDLHGNEFRRRIAGRAIRMNLDNLARSKTKKDFDQYIEEDIEWQISLVADSNVTFRLNMLEICQSLKRSLLFIKKVRCEMPVLTGLFDEDFRLVFPKWWKRWADFNSDRLDQLVDGLVSGACSQKQLKQLVADMTNETANNIMAVSNALERHREGSFECEIHYEDIKTLCI